MPATGLPADFGQLPQAIETANVLALWLRFRASDEHFALAVRCDLFQSSGTRTSSGLHRSWVQGQ
jgi:hypothetical protein